MRQAKASLAKQTKSKQTKSKPAGSKPAAEPIPRVGSEFVYVLVNSSMPGLCKIGKTTRDPNGRVSELSRATGVPTPFVLVWSEEISDCSEAERLIHARLADLRESTSREFFRIDTREAIVIVKEVCESLRGEANQQRDPTLPTGR